MISKDLVRDQLRLLLKQDGCCVKVFKLRYVNLIYRCEYNQNIFKSVVEVIIRINILKSHACTLCQSNVINVCVSMWSKNNKIPHVVLGCTCCLCVCVFVCVCDW